MKHITVRQITFSALVGAMYVTLCYFGNIFGLNFGIFQCRFAEALTVLPFLCPTAAWGLFAGCILSNLLSPYGVGALLAWSETGFTAAFPGLFAFNALSVGGAELLVCYVLGLPLLSLLERMKIFPENMEKIRKTA